MSMAAEQDVFPKCTRAIGYEAFGHEVPLSACDWIPVPLHAGMILVPKTPPEPEVLAAELPGKLPTDGVCIFVPGTHFDASGTRIGRGGGWYDRFLAAVPKTWVRIGVTDIAYFSGMPLPRASHDEPVDFVVVRSGKSWRTYRAGSR